MRLQNLDTTPADATLVSGRFSDRIPAQTLDHARQIGLTLLRAHPDQKSNVLGITSAVTGEGKTTISLALAEVMGTDFGLNVVLLDTHPERPWSRFDESLATIEGLVDWLRGDCTLSEAQIAVHDRWSVLPLGQHSLSTRELLQYLTKNQALEQLREHYDLIILDLPDLNNPSGPALANLCDGLVLVVRAGQTPVDVVKEHLPLLGNVPVHGAVLNRHKSAIPSFIRRIFS